MPTQIHFLIPDPGSFPSGGNRYNYELIRALGAKGIHVSHSSYNPDIYYASPETCYILDSIYLDQLTQTSILPENCIGLIHHLRSLYPLSNEYYRSSESAILDKMHGHIVTSTFTRDYLIHQGLKNQICVIEPAPMMSFEERSPRRKVSALMLGNCIPRKGQLGFLQALDNSGIEPYFSLTIAGSLNSDPDYSRACQELILGSPLLMKTVKMTGEQDPAAISGLYRKSNLFISAARMETYGMAIQDAVVCGLPVIALDAGYAGMHIEEGVNGYRGHSDIDLTKHLASLVSNPEDFLVLQEKTIRHPGPYHTWPEAGAKCADFCLS